MIFQFPLDHQIVCFDDQSERLSVANPVGARILELHVSGLLHSEICDIVFSEYDADREKISLDVHSFVRRWETDDITKFRPKQTHAPDTQYDRHRSLNRVSEMTFHLPSGSFSIHSESAAIIELLRPMFRLSEAIVQAKRQLTVEIFEEGELFPIVCDGQTLDTGYSVEHAAVLCLRAMNVLVSSVESHAITLHAAAIALGGEGILMAACGGSGKTTLTAYLIAHGYELINDDSVHLSAEPIHIVPIPVAMSIKAGSWDILAQWYPYLLQQKIYGTPDFEQRYLPPTDEQVACEPVPCKAVCFPRFSAGVSTQFKRVDRPTALTKLIESGCYLSKPVQASQVDLLVRWVQSLEFYVLEFSSVHDAEAVIRKLLHQ